MPVRVQVTSPAGITIEILELPRHRWSNNVITQKRGRTERAKRRRQAFDSDVEVANNRRAATAYPFGHVEQTIDDSIGGRLGRRDIVQRQTTAFLFFDGWAKETSLCLDRVLSLSLSLEGKEKEKKKNKWTRRRRQDYKKPTPCEQQNPPEREIDRESTLTRLGM
jgi:hypothetical protein